MIRAGVKVCGIMTAEHAQAAMAAGVDYLGIMFAPSRRKVDVEQARQIVAALETDVQQSTFRIKVVGVFVNEPPDVINAVVEQVGLDYVQLSGHETREQAAKIVRPVIKVVRFDQHPSEAEWLASIADTPLDGPHLLIDAHVNGSYGGAGVIGDWQSAAALARRVPVGLAGGLTPDNVAAAIAAVKPSFVDVSSGVETNGVKDISKIVAFVHAAKQQYAVSHLAVQAAASSHE